MGAYVFVYVCSEFMCVYIMMFIKLYKNLKNIKKQNEHLSTLLIEEYLRAGYS